jgi:hypothetical protein
MIHYKDMAFCSYTECSDTTCCRNQKNINLEHYKAAGLPLALSDFMQCKKFKQENEDLFEGEKL